MVISCTCTTNMIVRPEFTRDPGAPPDGSPVRRRGLTLHTSRWHSPDASRPPSGRAWWTCGPRGAGFHSSLATRRRATGDSRPAWRRCYGASRRARTSTLRRPRRPTCGRLGPVTHAHYGSQPLLASSPSLEPQRTPDHLISAPQEPCGLPFRRPLRDRKSVV